MRQPALLLGSPRSGTTWLAKIIDSHPEVLYRHEPDSINVRTDIPFVPAAASEDDDLELCREYLQTLFAERASKSAGSQPMFAKAFRGSVAEAMHRASVFAVKGGERLPGLGAGVGRLQIPDIISASAQPQLFIKSVSSLCRAQLFSRAWPGLRIIHILRHPCAYVASTLRGNKLGLLKDDAYIETLARMPEAGAYELDLERLGAMSAEQQLAARWMLQNEKVMRDMHGADNYRRVIYEDLCAEPESVATQLLQFIGLDMHEQTREFIRESSVGVSQEVRYFYLRRDSGAAASRWMSELSERQIDDIRRLVSMSEVGKLYFPDA